MNDDNLFENYQFERQGFSSWIKRPKSWVLIVSSLSALILITIFIRSVSNQMSPKEIADAIQLTVTDSLWVVKETTPYDVKIVPSITFTVRNAGALPLEYVSFEGVFEFEDTGKVHTDGSAYMFNKIPLDPGRESEPIVIKGAYGYTASSLPAFLKNKQEWKSMRVKIFARVKSSPPVRLGDYYTIKKELEGQAENGASLRVGETPEDDPLFKASFEKYGKALQLEQTDSIWVFKTHTAERTVITPSITFQIKNTGAEPLKDFILKGEFLFSDTREKLDETAVPALEKELAPGALSAPVTLTSALGYESTGKKELVLTPETWRSCEVRIYAKQKEMSYVLLGTYPIRRRVEGVR